MKRQIKVGILIPVTTGERLAPPEDFWTFFQEAERLGFESLWVVDRVFRGVNVLDAFTVLTWAATATQRVRLGTAVLLLAFRSPVLVAKTVASLDYLSGGRVTLGVSLGGQETEYRGLGVPMNQRVARLRENLTVLRRLLSEKRVTLHGRFQDLDDVGVDPKATQPGGVPILMGASAEPGLRRTVELADGWIAGASGTVEEFRTARHLIERFAQDQGRDLSRFHWAKLFYTAVADDREHGKEMLRTYLQAYSSRPYDIEGSCVFGPPDECMERLAPYAEAGLQSFILGPPSLDPEHLRRIAEELVPRLS